MIGTAGRGDPAEYERLAGIAVAAVARHVDESQAGEVPVGSSPPLTDLVDELELRTLVHPGGLDADGFEEWLGRVLARSVRLHHPAQVAHQVGPRRRPRQRPCQKMLDRVGGLLSEVGRIVRSSHERWDGSGYPDGLAGEQIPLGATIVSCCDAFNAMTTDRSYRSAMPLEDAIAELHAESGKQFNPAVVEVLARIIERAAPERVGISAESVPAG